MILIALVIGLVLVVLIMVGVALAMRNNGWGGSLEPGVAIPPPVAQPQPGGDVETAARQLLAQRKKIEAIKLVRERSGMGLKEAKDYVDRLEPTVGDAPLPSLSTPPLPAAALESEVRGLLAQGRKIEAVKLVRQQSGMGLKESKDYVDALEQRM